MVYGVAVLGTEYTSSASARNLNFSMMMVNHCYWDERQPRTRLRPEQLDSSSVNVGRFASRHMIERLVKSENNALYTNEIERNYIVVNDKHPNKKKHNIPMKKN